MYNVIVLLRCVRAVRPNKKISVFRATGLEKLGRVRTQIFFSEKEMLFYA